MPNFKKLAKTYEKTAVVALQQFVRIASVYDPTTIKENQPYGAKVKEALDYFAKLGTDYGFKVDKVDGRCTELSFGENGPLIGIYGHSDVVPATGKWVSGPYEGKVTDGKMIGRGTSDDKGPLLASLYAVKLLKDNGFLKNFRVKIVSGGDEERGSSCLRYYFEKHHGEEPKYGFTPDADYPLIYAEKGIRDYWLSRICNLSPIVAIDGGLVMNAVCDSLMVTLAKDAKFEKYLLDNKVNCENDSNDTVTIIRFQGKAAHGSTPELGVSAILSAFKILGDYYKLEPLSTFAAALSSPHGESFGGASHSPELGDATYNYGIAKYDGKVLKVSLDFRYGESAKPDELIASLMEKSKMVATLLSEASPLLFDKKSLLVATLMKAYRKETWKLFDKPLAIGGGTYAKEAKNTVAFGASFKGHEGNMHSPDEYIYLSDFYKDIAIYARAIYMLGNLK